MLRILVFLMFVAVLLGGQPPVQAADGCNTTLYNKAIDLALTNGTEINANPIGYIWIEARLIISVYVPSLGDDVMYIVDADYPTSELGKTVGGIWVECSEADWWKTRINNLYGA